MTYQTLQDMPCVCSYNNYQCMDYDYLHEEQEEEVN